MRGALFQDGRWPLTSVLLREVGQARQACPTRNETRPVRVAGRSGSPHALADVGFQHAEGPFVPLQRHGQSAQQALRREVIHDDPLRDLD